MKKRSVRNDPINTRERDRGAVVVNFMVDLDKAVPMHKAVPVAKTTRGQMAK